jgi:hypothetical protein
MILFGALASLAATLGCRGNLSTVLARDQEARRLTSELRVGLMTAADATDRAVMAETDEASAAFAKEASTTTEGIRAESAALRLLLGDLGYEEEIRLLSEFDESFGRFRQLDQTILGHAVENTNLKAQRLSFHEGREAADAFKKAIEALVGTAPTRSACQARELALRATLALREIQLVEGPHISEADDAEMTRLEREMAVSEAAIRASVTELGRLLGTGSRTRLTEATTLLDRFKEINDRIVSLSRRNTNVRSLALSLGEKRSLTAVCAEKLAALGKALDRRGLAATR